MSLASPQQVIARLEEIECDLAERQNRWEAAAQAWFVEKRDREQQRAQAFLVAEGTVAERNAVADRHTGHIGKVAEAEYEAQKAVVRTLETRANIGMSILRAQGRLA